MLREIEIIDSQKLGCWDVSDEPISGFPIYPNVQILSLFQCLWSANAREFSNVWAQQNTDFPYTRIPQALGFLNIWNVPGFSFSGHPDVQALDFSLAREGRNY